MLAYWKANEREERELRKKAERDALIKAKQEEEKREKMQQARKLNFLLTQTELFSHFVSKKIQRKFLIMCQYSLCFNYIL
jgi:DNA helicase INO80